MSNILEKVVTANLSALEVSTLQTLQRYVRQ